MSTKNSQFVKNLLETAALFVSSAPLTEFMPEFVCRMMRAMAVSFHKYGPVAKGFPARFNAIKCLKDRLKLYEETGNQDYLTDVANFAMIEVMRPSHPAPHYTPTDGGEGRRGDHGPSVNLDNNGNRV